MTTFPNEGDVCGYVMRVRVAADYSAIQCFYYCVAHKEHAGSDLSLIPVLYEDIDSFIVCFLCHQKLRSVAYIEDRIARGEV